MKSEKLRCPGCGLEATIRVAAKEISTQYRTATGVDYRTYQTELPVICHVCDTALKVVRECPTCKGSGKWKTAVSTTECECPDCNGAGQILEEQPC